MSEPTYDFESQVALVAGASSGIGLATAHAFAVAGASVMLADINEDALRAATDDLTTAGHTALGVTCDVSDEAQVAALVDRTVANFGRLDMAFNNAGIQIPVSGRPTNRPNLRPRHRDQPPRRLELHEARVAPRPALLDSSKAAM